MDFQLIMTAYDAMNCKLKTLQCIQTILNRKKRVK